MFSACFSYKRYVRNAWEVKYKKTNFFDKGEDILENTLKFVLFHCVFTSRKMANN